MLSIFRHPHLFQKAFGLRQTDTKITDVVDDHLAAVILCLID